MVCGYVPVRLDRADLQSMFGSNLHGCIACAAQLRHSVRWPARLACETKLSAVRGLTENQSFGRTQT